MGRAEQAWVGQGKARQGRQSKGQGITIIRSRAVAFVLCSLNPIGQGSTMEFV